MNVHDYFIQCEKQLPGKCTSLRRTSFALRRAQVDTMEKLCLMKRQFPEKLAGVRYIGTQSIAIIDEVVGLFEGKEIEASKKEDPPL